MSPDFLVRPDGSILMAYSRTAKESGLAEVKDFAGPVILARVSTDQGATWGKPFLFQGPHDDARYILHPSFLKLPGGECLFAYNWNKSSGDAKAFVRRSTDGGQTWGPRSPITETPGYHVMCPNHLLRLRSGRIVAATSWTADIGKRWENECLVHYSDDEGRTWKRSAKTTRVGKNSEEPTVAELADGRLLMHFRTTTGYVGRAFSADRGETWSPGELTPFTAPKAPLHLVRLPQTGDLLFLWLNNPDAPGRKGEHWNERRPLVCAVSKDDGRTWSAPRVIAAGSPGTGPTAGDFGYATTECLGDTVLLGFHSYHAVHMARVPVAWFYGK